MRSTTRQVQCSSRKSRRGTWPGQRAVRGRWHYAQAPGRCRRTMARHGSPIFRCLDLRVRGGSPTCYLLSRPPVNGAKLGQRRPGAVMMIREHLATNLRDLQKTEFTGKEPADRRLIRCVEHRAARAATPGSLVSQLQRGKGFM